MNDPKSRKPALKPDDPEQSKRFLEAAREAEADETEKGAERAFKTVAKPRKANRGTIVRAQAGLLSVG
jgi:hypothetical protein